MKNANSSNGATTPVVVVINITTSTTGTVSIQPNVPNVLMLGNTLNYSVDEAGILKATCNGRTLIEFSVRDSGSITKLKPVQYELALLFAQALRVAAKNKTLEARIEAKISKEGADYAFSQTLYFTPKTITANPRDLRVSRATVEAASKPLTASGAKVIAPSHTPRGRPTRRD